MQETGQEMEQVISVEELFGQTIVHLKKIVATLTALQPPACSERTALLVGAFLPQTATLLRTVENISRRQSARSLARALRIPGTLIQYKEMPQQADSLALTLWLIGELNAQADLYASQENTGKPGPAKAGIAELAALLVAQGKRIALEAHRFSDL